MVTLVTCIDTTTIDVVNEEPGEELELIESGIQPRLLYEEHPTAPASTDHPILLLQTDKRSPQLYHHAPPTPYLIATRKPPVDALTYSPSYPLTAYLPKKVTRLEEGALSNYRLPVTKPAPLYSVPLENEKALQPYQSYPGATVTPKPATGLLPILQPRIVTPTPTVQPYNPQPPLQPYALPKPRLYPVNQQYTRPERVRPESYTRPQSPQPISYYPVPSPPLRQSSSSNLPSSQAQLPNVPYPRSVPYVPTRQYTPNPPPRANEVAVTSRPPVAYSAIRPPVGHGNGLAYSPSNYYPSRPQPSPPRVVAPQEAGPVAQPAYPAPSQPYPHLRQQERKPIYPPPVPYVKPSNVPPIVVNRATAPYS